MDDGEKVGGRVARIRIGHGSQRLLERDLGREAVAARSLSMEGFSGDEERERGREMVPKAAAASGVLG